MGTNLNKNKRNYPYFATTPFVNEFYEFLDSRGVSMRQTAKEAGIHPSMITWIVNGYRHFPQPGARLTLLKFFRVLATKGLITLGEINHFLTLASMAELNEEGIKDLPLKTRISLSNKQEKLGERYPPLDFLEDGVDTTICLSVITENLHPRITIDALDFTEGLDLVQTMAFFRHVLQDDISSEELMESIDSCRCPYLLFLAGVVVPTNPIFDDWRESRSKAREAHDASTANS